MSEYLQNQVEEVAAKLTSWKNVQGVLIALDFAPETEKVGRVIISCRGAKEKKYDPIKFAILIQTISRWGASEIDTFELYSKTKELGWSFLEPPKSDFLAFEADQ